MKVKIDARYFKGTTNDQEREKREMQIIKSLEVLDLVRKEVEIMKDDMNVNKFSKGSFVGDWTHSKSHDFGYLHALEDILAILPTREE